MTFRLLPDHPLHDIIDGVGCIAIAFGLIIVYCSAKGAAIRDRGHSVRFGHKATCAYTRNTDIKTADCRAEIRIKQTQQEVAIL